MACPPHSHFICCFRPKVIEYSIFRVNVWHFGALIIWLKYSNLPLTYKNTQVSTLQTRGKYFGNGPKKRSKGKLGRHDIEVSEDGSDDPFIDSNLLSWSTAREKNALDRDFTVNSLMYDPFSRIVFDYTNGIQDCRSIPYTYTVS